MEHTVRYVIDTLAKQYIKHGTCRKPTPTPQARNYT